MIKNCVPDRKSTNRTIYLNMLYGQFLCDSFQSQRGIGLILLPETCNLAHRLTWSFKTKIEY